MRDDFRIEVQDFTDRVSAEWAAASPEDVDASANAGDREAERGVHSSREAHSSKGSRALCHFGTSLMHV